MKKDVLAFLSELAENEETSRRLFTGGKDEIMSAARRLGFSFTWEELEYVFRQVKGMDDELEDEVLEAITAGVRRSDILRWVSHHVRKLDPFRPG